MGAGVETPPRAASEPAVIPGLALRDRLARGGFAEVWRAEQVSLGRKVAVKILRRELLGQPEMVKLFEREARVLARLNHPNVVQVIDRGSSPQGPYFVMEYVEGETLQSLLSAGKLSRDRAMAILLEAARGLAYAHLNGVVHRDVKPANILVGREGAIKISDFGIAAVRAAAGTGSDGDPGDDTGEQPPKKRKKALGTRAFMAPEQRRAFDEVGPQADVYSLGVILHRIVTGKLPEGPGAGDFGEEVPERLRPILEQALKEDPKERFPDAGRFRAALVNALGGRHLDPTTHEGAESAIGDGRGFELLDVIRQDRWRSVYLVRRGGAGGERIVVKRYRRNAEALKTTRALARIDHPNVVRITAVGEQPDSFIIVMEHLSGGDLRERLVKPHPWREVARVGQSVAAALACAHQHGIVHGNLRPSNVLFGESGAIRVADFGLPAHYAGDGGKRDWYAPPGEPRSVQADLYALGSILFEMLYAETVGETDPMARLAQPDPDVPEALRHVIRRLLAPPAERFRSAEPVAAVLGDVLGSATPDPGPETKPTDDPLAEAAVAPAPRPAAPRHPEPDFFVPALFGLFGLLFVWLLERPVVQHWLERLFSGG